MKFSGEYITNITVSYCPTFDNTFASKRGFSLSNLRPKHVLWSILGVAAVVVIGMMVGMLVNCIKAVYVKKIKSQTIRYYNLNTDTA